MRRCFEPGLPPACMIGLDFHAPRVAALPFETQNAITGRIDSKPHGRPIRMIRNPQAISYRLMSALHCVPIPADECYRQRSGFVYVTLPIWIICQDCHAANFCLAWLLKCLTQACGSAGWRGGAWRADAARPRRRQILPRCPVGFFAQRSSVPSLIGA